MTETLRVLLLLVDEVRSLRSEIEQLLEAMAPPPKKPPKGPK